MQAALSDWENLIGRSDEMLRIGEEGARAQRRPGGWQAKQILGHLIDSAANNHHRFVRLQYEAELQFPAYRQQEWVNLNHYAERPWAELVNLWLAYNRHLLHVAVNADPAALGNVWKSPHGDCTLEFLIADYVKHLRHHVDQILEADLLVRQGGDAG